MSDLTPTHSQELVRSTGSAPATFNRRESKALDRAQHAAVAAGLIGGTQLASEAFLTGLAIQGLGMLTREADHQFDGDPRHDARQQFLLDEYTRSAGAIIRGFGQ